MVSVEGLQPWNLVESSVSGRIKEVEGEVDYGWRDAVCRLGAADTKFRWGQP